MGGMGGFGDIFEDFFGGFGGMRHAPRGPARGDDLRYDMEITFQEAVFGAEKEIEIPRLETCPVCQGSGAEPGTKPIPCPQCNGAGEVRHAQETILGRFVSVTACPHCNGEREIAPTPCTNCRGQKRVRVTRRLSVSIPAGVDDGMRIRLAGEGEPGDRNGPAGSLYVFLHVKPHPLFKRQQNAILLKYPINPVQAALGCEADILTLDGMIKLTIPPETRHGNVFRLPGKGVPILHTNRRGDQLVSICLVVPDKLYAKQVKLVDTVTEEDVLPSAAFIEQARAVLERLLIGQSARLQIRSDNQIQVHFSGLSGCHYELWLHAHTIEVGLHFETSQKLNYARMEPFLSHQDVLSQALGEQVRVEKWGNRFARVFYEMSKPPLTESWAADCAAQLHRFVTETLPILREAFPERTEHPRSGARTEAQTQAQTIVDTQIAAVRDFLNGRAGRPSDERLCDWVNFCYEFGLYREGRDLFRLIDPSQVNDWYYERAMRLARVCTMKVAGQA